ncbi:MAG TPA: hypothetical protein VG370_20075 [Chloroflexota bacterium]|nr:hypothetical protein [Chloroflexota bacterium]
MHFLCTRLGVAIGVISLVAILFPAYVAAVFPYALPNAVGTKTQSNTGASAVIETTDPTLSGGGWVYHRVIGRYPEANAYVEVGWLKDANQGNVPRVYWTTRSTGGVVDQNFPGVPNPTMGVSYNYQVFNTATDGTWAMFYNGSNVATRIVGYIAATEWASGGEANNNDQGMGGTDHNNVAWRDSGGNWFCACGYEVYNNNPMRWVVNVGPNNSSWTIIG